MEVLTVKQLKSQAPAAFMNSPHERVSERYNFLPTTEIMKDLDKNGWVPITARQTKPYKHKDEINYVSHLISFAPKDMVRSITPSDTIPQLILLNNHQGYHSARVFMGLVRVICSNGLVRKEVTAVDVRLTHYKEQFESREFIIECMNNYSEVLTDIKSYQKIKLTDDKKIEFAKFMMKAIHKDDYKNKEFNFDNIILPLRTGDQKNDLWTVFNIMQEKIIKGGIVSYIKTEDNKVRQTTSRGFSNVYNEQQINIMIWGVMQQFSTKC